jgi:hypothetical protein
MATSDNKPLVTEYDVARVANALIKIVPPHYKYPDSVPVYTRNGEASCIVGHIVKGLSLDHTKLIENVPPSRQPDLGVVFTPNAAEMLDIFQENQDDGVEWEDVVFDTYRLAFPKLEDFLKSL